MSYETNKIRDNYLYAPLPLWFLYLYFIKRSWLHCNPSNSLINNPEVLQHYFFGNEKIIFENKNNNLKHYIDTFDNIKNIIFDNDFKLVFIYGNKGYGKTTIQNYLLMKYTKDLNKEGLTWLRIDVSKIYREWQRLHNIDLESYLYIQVVYVYIRYYSTISNSHDIVFKNQFENIKLELNEKDLFKYFKDFEEKLISSENGKYERKEYLSKNLTKTKKIAEILLKYLSKSIILFIDGIDNLDYQNSYRKDFAKQIKDILTVSNEKFSLQNFKSVIIALRKENERFFNDILRAFEQNHYVDSHLRIEQYEIENILFPSITNNIQSNFQTPNLSESGYIKQLILSSLKELASVNSIKIKENFTDTSKNTTNDKAIEEYISHMIITLEECDEKNIKKESTNFQLSLNYAAVVFDIERRVGLTINNIANIAHYLLDSDNKIFEFLEKYEEYIAKCLTTKGLSKEIENIDIMGELFQNNYREALSHAINSYLYIKKFIQRKDNSTIDDIDTYLNKNSKSLLLMEALFKNGNLYGITNQDFRYMAYFKNIAFINLFNLELTGLNTQPPIEVILVLSYLNDSNKSFSYQTLSSDLDIQEEDIIKILEKFEEFGYVKFNLERNNYKISRKGQIILEYSFRDINILNTYCYGGKFYSGESRKIKTYGIKWENYITTVLFNVTFIIKYLEKELNEYEKHARNDAINLKNTIHNLRKRIHNKFLQDDFLFFYNKLNDENKKSLHQEFKNEDIDELFSQILKTPRHTEIRQMNLFDFIIFAKKLDTKFPKNKDERINYRLTFVKYFYAKSSEQILDTTQLHKYIFEDLADAYEDNIEYKKRVELCNLIDIELTILNEIDNYLNEVKQQEQGENK